jgi:hypothetical protein
MNEDKDKDYEKPKPWLLHDISSEAREIVLKNSKRSNVRIGQWVNYIIVKSEKAEEEREVKRDQEEEDKKTFSEMMEELPTKALIINIYNRLNSAIDEVSKKVGRPWWKFWG